VNTFPVDIAGQEHLSAVLRTAGEYQTEGDSVAALLSVVNRSHWTVSTEVTGWLLHPRADSDGKLGLRVDVMLEPTEELMLAGWRYGPVPIECKRSEFNCGPAIAQVMDYTRAVWELRESRSLGYRVMSRLCFLWPLKPPGGTLGSVMVNNRIGGAFLREYRRDRLVLMFNSTVAYEDSHDGPPTIANELRGGQKTGSR